MLSVLQLRMMAARWLTACKDNVRAGHLDVAMSNIGFVMEFIVKARVCHDLNLAGFPENEAEFQRVRANTGHWLKTHNLQTLINLTAAKRIVSSTPDLLTAWSTCVGWTVETRYRPMGSAPQEQIDSLILSAESLVRVITNAADQMTAVQQARASGDPWAILVGLERDLAIERGEFALYALMMREANIDVVVSADWIDPKKGARDVCGAVHAAFGGHPWPVGLVVAVEPTHPIVTGLSIFGGPAQIRNTRVHGIPVDMLWKVAPHGPTGLQVYVANSVIH